MEFFIYGTKRTQQEAATLYGQMAAYAGWNGPASERAFSEVVQDQVGRDFVATLTNNVITVEGV